MGHAPIVDAQQIRAARALLNWSQSDLAQATSLSIATIRKLELGGISPRHSTTNIIRQTMESAGLEFIDSDGVRRRRKDVLIYQGPSCMELLYADVAQTLDKTGDEVLIVVGTYLSPNFLRSSDFSNLRNNLKRKPNISLKCLFTENFDLPFYISDIRCRSISKLYVDPAPFWVYGDKYAMVVPEGSETAKVIVVQSLSANLHARSHFTSMWDKAIPITHSQNCQDNSSHPIYPIAAA